MTKSAIKLPPHITSGVGTSSEIIDYENAAGPVLVITTKYFLEKGGAEKVVSQFDSCIPSSPIAVDPNPDVEDISNWIEILRSQPPSLVVAIGGGSVIDFAKAIAALVGRQSRVLLRDILEGRSVLPPDGDPIPVIAIPTTAGTGSEVTQFATIWDKSAGKKFSLEAETLRPDRVVLDPALTQSMPSDLSLFCALDTLSHGVESLWNKRASVDSIAFATAALSIGCGALNQVLSEPDDLSARAEMQLASTLAGLAISSTRTAIAHSISYPLTAHFGVPHGLACSFTLPAISEFIFERTGDAEWLPELANEAIQLVRTHQLSARVLEYASAPEILSRASEMFHPARADNFCLKLTMEDVVHIVERALK